MTVNLDDKITLLQKLLNSDAASLKKPSYQQRYSKLVITRRTTEFLFILLLQLINIKIDILTQHPPLVSLSAATNLILFFWRGFHVLPSLLLSHLLIWYGLTHHFTMSCFTAFSFALPPYLVVKTVHRLLGPLVPFSRFRDWCGYLTILLVIYGGSTCLSSVSHPPQLLADLYSTLLLTPANLIYAAYPFLRKLLTPTQRRFLRNCCVGILFGTITLFIPYFFTNLMLLVFPILLIGSMIFLLANRLALHGVAFGSLTLALSLILLNACLPDKLTAIPIITQWILFLSVSSFMTIGYFIAIQQAQKNAFSVSPQKKE